MLDNKKQLCQEHLGWGKGSRFSFRCTRSINNCITQYRHYNGPKAKTLVALGGKPASFFGLEKV